LSDEMTHDMDNNNKIKIKILIIDDHELVRNSIKLMLKNKYNNCMVVEASNASECMLLMSNDPNYDLVILDLKIPGINGYLLLEKIMRLSKSSRVIVLSGIEDNEVATKVISLGAQTFLNKSMDSKVILQTIDLVLNDRLDISSNNSTPSFIDNSKPSNLSIVNMLSSRQKRVFEHLSNGLTNKEISSKLYLSEGTVKNHITAILSTLNLKNRTQVALLAKEYSSNSAYKEPR